MARRLAALLFAAALALPAGADAASKRVTVPVPANGDVAFTQYRVTAASPGKATIPNARRLGDLRIDVSGGRIASRSYEVTVLVLNPTGRASAAQNTQPVIQLSSGGEIGARKTGSAINLFSQPPTRRESAALDRLCAQPRSRTRRLFSRSRFLSPRTSPMRNFRFQAAACQDRPPAQTIAGRSAFEALGVPPPACMGSARRYLDLTNEIDARMICSGPTRALGLLASPGNAGLTCLGPPGSQCAVGPTCSPFPPESGCFVDNDNFAMNTPLNFRVSYEGPIQPPDITAIWVPQGSPVVDHQFAYLRHVLDGP
ncbi:MAG TPA: hypothetical protein VK486_06645 [Thermoleophilaceae bacterium]|nr:hypothetical protein [Thermoleophilaceae bacterium]